MTVKRWSIIAGTAGVVGGLALGVTGFASAAGSTPTPSPSHGPGGRSGPGPDFRGGPGHRPGFGGGGFRGGGFGAGGLVTAVSGSSLTLRTPAGSKTVGLTGSTTYYEGQAKGGKSDLKVGEIVALRLADPRAASPVATVVTVLPAHLSGFVTKVDGSTITITDESGFTRTILTSSATTYEKDGAAGKLSDVTVGSVLRATGAVDGDGTTLDATKVSVGKPADRPWPHPSGLPGAQPGANQGGDPQGPPAPGNGPNA